MSINTIADIQKFLDSIPAFKANGKRAANFSLERFERFCSAIGDPQKQFSSIHVAGSNGKGSTCQLIASIYIEANYTVGVYTSPHILSYEERFSINGRLIDETELVDFFRDYQASMQRFSLTYFEISTAIAFWWFARRQVDVAVIETGLGGRLDATNIIMPLASVITTVTLDHTDILGDTIEAIAAEKAGIIKQKVPLILGNVPEKAEKIICQRAHEKHVRVLKSGALNPSGRNGIYYLYENGKQIILESTMQTPVQACNIAAAWVLSRALHEVLPVTEIQRKKGIQKVNVLFPNMARFEKLHPALAWYFDGAHNLQAVQKMKNMVQTLQPVGSTILVLSLMKDKINKKMMIEFSEFKKIIYHTLPLGRAATMKDIRKWLPEATPITGNKRSRNQLLKELESELVIFAGSFYFYPTVRDWLSSFMIDR